MADNNPQRDGEESKGGFGLILGIFLAAVAAIFILTGGQLGGVKEVNSDADMPPIAKGTSTK
jgi:hypothetical protein